MLKIRLTSSNFTAASVLEHRFNLSIASSRDSAQKVTNQRHLTLTKKKIHKFHTFTNSLAKRIRREERIYVTLNLHSHLSPLFIKPK